MVLLRRLRNPSRTRAYRECVPEVPWHNDFYLVEFPKSGVTWLSTILANLALIESGRNEVASYSSVHMFVPDIHVTQSLGELPYTRPPVRFIKSHAQYNPFYAFLVYLVRHPLGVMKSYYRFTSELGDEGRRSFDSFCRSKKMGIPAWREHIRSWLVGKAVPQRLHLCRYEDLCAKPYDEILRISDNFGWNLSDDAIRKAIALSSMDRMKESESLYRNGNPRYGMEFVGGVNRFEVEERTIRYIESYCRHELELLSYGPVGGLGDEHQR